MNLNILGRVSLFIVIFLGILNQPYDYYVFLRIYVCIVSVILTIEGFNRKNRNGFEYLYLSLAIIFNPLLPIAATRDLWILLDIAFAILIGISFGYDKPERKTDKNDISG